MPFFRTLTTLIAPKKAQFTKRLIARRREGAANALSMAGAAARGTAGYRLRTWRLDVAEYAVTPEATVVNILEQYWQPHIANFYVKPSFYGSPYQLRPGASEEEKAAVAEKRANDLAAHIEYRLTGRPHAREYLPEFHSFIEYMRYRIQAEHPKNPYLGTEDGFTDEFFQYALDESRYVFDRT